VKTPGRVVALCAGVVLVTACAGRQSAVPPATGHGAPSAHARVTIAIPKASAGSAARGRRAPAYVSAATQSATLNFTVQGTGAQVSGYPTTVDLTPTSTGCSSTLASTVCTLSFALSAGSYDLTLTTYDQTGGAGNALSAAQSVPFTIVAGEANSISLTLGGLPSSVAILPGSSTLTTTSTGGFTLKIDATASVSVYGVDADGNLILGAGAPSVALTSGTPAQVSVAGPSNANPNAFTVTSNAQSASVTLTATATPTATSGASAVTASAAVGPPGGATIVVATGSGATAYDEFGNLKSGVDGLAAPGPPLEGVTYASGTGTLYATLSEGSPPIVDAFTPSGLNVPLSGSFGGITNDPTLLSYDPTDSWLYIANSHDVLAYDLNGNEQTLTAPIALASTVTGLAYDSANGLLYATAFLTGANAVTAYDGQGNEQTLSGGFPGFTSPYRPTGIAFDSGNGFIYVGVEDAHSLWVFDQQGNRQTVSGTFPGLPSQAFAVAYDPDNGLLYVASTSGNTVYVFDENGNPVRSFSDADDEAVSGIAIVP
jgi:DNA-binding beta-propeller fold protein YncE